MPYTGVPFFFYLLYCVFTASFRYLDHVLKLSPVFTTVTCCIVYSLMSNRLCLLCSSSLYYHLGLFNHQSMMFTHWQNHLKMHFSECIPTVKQHMTIYLLHFKYSEKHINEWSCTTFHFHQILLLNLHLIQLKLIMWPKSNFILFLSPFQEVTKFLNFILTISMHVFILLPHVYIIFACF